MENANRKGFVREGKAIEEPKGLPGRASLGVMRLDTQPAAHFLSIQALFWNLDGTVTGRTVWLPAVLPGKAMSNRKQTAVGHE